MVGVLRSALIIGHHYPLWREESIPIHTANGLQRWATVLLGHDFEIKYAGTERFEQGDARSQLKRRNANSQSGEDVTISLVEVDSEVKTGLQ